MADISERETLFREVMESRLSMLHTALPCKVESYDATTQTCDCTPQVKETLPDGEGGYVHKTLPKLSGVPVCFQRGGGFHMTFPLAAGDYVMVHFAERSLRAWYDKGEVTEAGDQRLHPLDGAFAVPMGYPKSGKLSDAHAENMVIGKDGGHVISIDPDGNIILGAASGGKRVARKDDPVKVTIPANSFLVSCSGSPAVGVLNSSPVDVTGTVTDGSATVTAVD